MISNALHIVFKKKFKRENVAAVGSAVQTEEVPLVVRGSTGTVSASE